MKFDISVLILSAHLNRIVMDCLKYELQLKYNIVINEAQIFILSKIGRDRTTLSTLNQNTGRYLNVNYNVKKMLEAGYLGQARSNFDKRIMFIFLTEKGLELYKIIENFIEEEFTNVRDENLYEFVERLKNLERYFIQENTNGHNAWISNNNAQ